MIRHLRLWILIPSLFVLLFGCETDFDSLFGKNVVHTPSTEDKSNDGFTPCTQFNVGLVEAEKSPPLHPECKAPDDLSSILRHAYTTNGGRTLEFIFWKMQDGNFPKLDSLTMMNYDGANRKKKEALCDKGPNDPDVIVYDCRVVKTSTDAPDEIYYPFKLILENENCLHLHATYGMGFPDGCHLTSHDGSVYVEGELVAPLRLSDQ